MWAFCTLCIKKLVQTQVCQHVCVAVKDEVCFSITKGIPLRNKPPTLHTSTEVIPSVGAVFHQRMEKMCIDSSSLQTRECCDIRQRSMHKGFSSV